MSVAVNSKDTLARLLATENVTIEHKNVSTAAFDPKNRVLTLPIWKDMSEDILTLLCAHEVSHALFSPTLDSIPVGMPKSWVNVVEDARIEKLIKRKFPGLAGNFFRGYKELFDRNFFETQNRELNSYSLIDRINLHFKNVPLVPFNQEEQEFVELVSECETFDDVLTVVSKLREYSLENEQEFEDIEEEFFDEYGEEVPSESQPSDVEESEEEEEGDSDESQQSEETETEDEEVDSEEESEQNLTSSSGVRDSETDEAWTRNQDELLDEQSRNFIYLSIPDVNLDEIVVDWKEYGRNLKNEISYIRENHLKKNQYEPFAANERRYLEFKNSTTKSVNYLVKEFEMRKSADEHRRSSIAKTGVIDTNLLHSYKWNEDIFKKLTVVPGAKNHGLLFFLDWSGSMDNCIRNTVKQLYNLIWFCTKVQIPFEVYAFSEIEVKYRPFGNRTVVEPKTTDIAINRGIRLHQLFTSDMKKQQLDDQMKHFWCLAYRHYLFSAWFGLGGTPLNETIICSKLIAERFLKKYKIQKLNFVFLTDGESNNLTRWIEPQSKYYSDMISVLLHKYTNRGDKFILRDNYRTYDLPAFSNYEQTETLLTWLKDNIDANVIGFRIAQDREAQAYVYYVGKLLWDSVKTKWRKEKSYTLLNAGGYDEMYLIRNDSQLGADTKDIEFESDATKAQIKKSFMNHMKSKTYNKVVLNKFIGVIA